MSERDRSYECDACELRKGRLAVLERDGDSVIVAEGGIIACSIECLNRRLTENYRFENAL